MKVTYDPAKLHNDLRKYHLMPPSPWQEIPPDSFDNFGATVFVPTDSLHVNDPLLNDRLKKAERDNEKVVFAAMYEGVLWFSHGQGIKSVLSDQFIESNTLLLLAGINPTPSINALVKWPGHVVIAPWVIYDHTREHFDIMYRENTFEEKEKIFLTFNRRTKIHRTRLIAHLSELNVLDDCFFSHFGDATLLPNEGDMLVDGHFHKNLLPHYKQDGDYNLIKKNIEKIGINCELDVPFFNKSTIGIKLNNTHEYYHKSMISIVTETWCNDYDSNDISISEKAFKPIFMSQPFILLGQKNILKYMKQLGFKTFDKWWDESYDSIDDHVERTIAVANLAKEISKWDDNKKKKFIKESNEICLHNYNHIRHNKDGILSRCSVSYPMVKNEMHLLCFGEGVYKETGDEFLNQIKANKDLPYVSYTRRTTADVDNYMKKWWGEIKYTNVRGYGYWIWKPYIILNKLNEMEDGELLHYVDVDLIDRISSRDWRAHMTELANTHLVANHLRDFPELHWNKKFFIDEMHLSHEYLMGGQVESGDICMVNNKLTRKVIRDWQTLMLYKFPKMVNDDSVDCGEFEEFQEHRHDQSVFSFLYKAFRQQVQIHVSPEYGLVQSKPGEVK